MRMLVQADVPTCRESPLRSSQRRMARTESRAQMVYEGQVKGVADLILLYPSGGKSALCVEMKVPKGKNRQAGTQSDEQENWQRLVETYGSTYVVCHGLIEFINAICAYLQVNSTKYIAEAINKYPLYR